MSEIKLLLRKNIEKVKPYQPGKPISEVKRELGLQRVIKLASNENPLGPSPKAVRAILKSVSELHRYPESNCFYLKRKLAERFNLKEDNFIIGNGSDEIIVLVLRALIDPGDKVMIAEPTFLIYEIQANACGARVIKIPLRNFRYDLKRMKENLTPEVKVVFIANPDNPTGTYVTEEEVKEFMENIPEKTFVFFDEAYYEFASTLPDYPRSLQFLNKRNIIITRSFSKAYGLAGLRVGYGMGRADLIAYLERIREPFNVNSLAQAGALSALEDASFLKKTLETTQEGKAYLYKEFEKLGLTYLPSATNFVLVDIGRDSERIFQQLLREGVIVRGLKPWGLDNFIRVTIGRREENEKFIKALKKVLRKGGKR
ncbi:MAG: histidinol-phosphate transaminase [Candidatus Omnitrophica bacterium]|nr:histidinol-phosphate transaminase [Candidatus Omnitrophota bacterium]MCM8798248.1 histidinol-phosphate transaminase [Candidatus Omnitrophota bacterium]